MSSIESVHLGFNAPLEMAENQEQWDALSKAKVDSMINEANQYQAWIGGETSRRIDRESRIGRILYGRKLWNNTSESNDYDYLYNEFSKDIQEEDGSTSSVTMTSPAKVRHIPIVKNKLLALVSRERERQFNPRIYSVSNQSILDKEKAHIEAIKSQERALFANRVAALKIRQQAIAQQKQVMQQMQQDPQYQEILPELEMIIHQAEMELEKDIYMNDKDRIKISNFYKYSYRDHYERVMDSILKSFISENRLNDLFNKGFKEKMIHDDPIFSIEFEKGMNEPLVSLCMPEYIYTRTSDSEEFLREAEFIVEHIPMSYASFIERFGNDEDLSKEDLETIRKSVSNFNHVNDAFRSSYDNIAPGGEYVGFNKESHWMRNANAIRVNKVVWKERVTVKAKEYEDKDGDTLIEFVDDDYNAKKGERIIKKYRMDAYQAYRISINSSENAFYTRIKRMDVQHRPAGKPSIVWLPYVGRQVNSFRKNTSMMYLCRDLQALYDILWYKQELLIILAGVKGIVYNLSQMPEGMSLKEVLYYMMQGLLVIETKGRDGTIKDASFNQYTQYDMGISNSMNTIEAIKQSIENTTSMLTGVYPQTLGEIQKTDQVGTYQMSSANAAASTEHLFADYDELKEQVCEMSINCTREAYKKGAIKLNIQGTVKQEIVRIPGDFEGEFTTRVANGFKERKSNEMVHMAIQNLVSTGAMSFSEMLTIQDMESIEDMRVAIADFEEKARELQSQQFQNEERAKAEIQQQMQQIKLQMDQALKAQEQEGQLRLKQFEAQIKQAEMALDKNISDAENQTKLEIAQMQDNTDKEGIRNEAAIEAAYLKFQYDQMASNEKLAKLNAHMSKIQNKVKSKEKVKD